ncbi:unnamed protein product [Tuber melanosporum]|uniref:(Perigord truffle) hypothetical protein n=1 Tax=Tuber melanosporum (strain Mel28) TaxID=656061 RepID=D5G5Y0_TUBMM|nr:uncharacterized protein GSTUM_00001620001 [Tuber melanosporum]CAZ79923.1 unnamed protein product [Tuber melanosporum]
MGNAKSTPLNNPYTGLPRVPTTNPSASTDKRDRTLTHLLRLNHHNYSLLYSQLRFHNHLPHALGSAYLLDAPSEHLTRLYESESKPLEPWPPTTPGEIARHDWREHISDRHYQRSYLDFFEDELVRLGYDWRRVVAEYLFQGPEPLIFGGIGGLGHPLIHLGYAFELGSKEVGMEALSLFATNYDFLHGYVDSEFPTAAGGVPVESPSPPLPTVVHDCQDPLEIIHRIRMDTAFHGIFPHAGAENIPLLFELREKEVLAYYRQFKIESPATAHKSLNHLAALLLTCSHDPGRPEFDFFVVHLTTVSYAIRILLPEVPEEYARPLVKMQWLFTIVVYLIQLSREVRPELLDGVELRGRGWGDVVRKALDRDEGSGSGGEMEDAHYLKAVRALKDSAQLWKDQEEFYLTAAVKFAWEFEKWSFGE